MGDEVYANGMAIAAKVGGGKVIAAFPDVCMSPPPPPAGPIPIPYPNSSFSKDLKKGSKTVKIGGKPMALKDSFYKTSPLGNEAATKSFGASVLSHQTSGKTQFIAYSFDVKVEGKNVCRHVDFATSNHGSYPGSTPPMVNGEKPTMIDAESTETKCDCCGGPKHVDPTGSSSADRPSMTSDEYYEPPAASMGKKQIADVELGKTTREYAKESGCDKTMLVTDESSPCAPHRATTKGESKAARDEYEAMISPNTPDDYFTGKYGAELGKEIQQRGAKMFAAKKTGGAKQIAHKTPLSGGGCPVGAGNLEPVYEDCMMYEKAISDTQSTVIKVHRKIQGLA